MNRRKALLALHLGALFFGLSGIFGKLALAAPIVIVFGRALFAEALGETDNLERAFELAKERVAEREQADDYQPSEPQIWAPRGVLQHWRSLRQSQAERALSAVASNDAND